MIPLLKANPAGRPRRGPKRTGPGKRAWSVLWGCFLGVWLCTLPVWAAPDVGMPPSAKAAALDTLPAAPDSATAPAGQSPGETSPIKDQSNPAAPTGQFNALAQGDAPVRIEADALSYDAQRDVYAGEGNVVITYGAGVLRAASVEYDRKNQLATARGGALLKMGEDSLEGDSITVNVADQTGVAYNSKAFYARNHFYIRGDKIEKTGLNSYRIEKPLATTCDGDNPDWQVAGSEMKVTLEGYGWVTNARLLTKGVPVVYTPLVAFPAKTLRQTGFLLPYLAYSRNKDGLDIEIPFYWAINSQMDATFYSRYMEKRGFKEGVEFRYIAGSRSYGTIYGDYMEDNKHVTETLGLTISRDWQEMHRRWSFLANHETKFDSQFYVRTDIRRVSDAWYFRDFNAHNYYLSNWAATEEDPFKKISFQGNEYLRSLESTARVFKGWNNYNLMARFSATDDFAAANNRTLQKYPEIIFTGIRQPLWATPLYVEFAGQYDYFYREDGARGHYAEVAPTVSLPLALSRYVRVTPQLTVREIYWSRDDRDANAANRSSDRFVYNIGVAASSRLSRIFDVRILNWDKIRHEIRPEIAYSYMPGVRYDNIPGLRQDDLPDYLPKVRTFLDAFSTFNAVDGRAIGEQNALAWSLTNTLTARVQNKILGAGYLELLRFKLYQVYDIYEAKKDMTGVTAGRRPLSDLGIEFDLAPHPYVSFSARNTYSVYSGWKELNFDLNLSDWRGDRLSVGYRYTLDSIEAINLDLRAALTDRLSGRLAVRLDQFNNQTVENTVGLLYTEQCWGLGVDYTRTHDDERIMLKISLTGLGSLGI